MLASSVPTAGRTDVVVGTAPPSAAADLVVNDGRNMAAAGLARRADAEGVREQPVVRLCCSRMALRQGRPGAVLSAPSGAVYLGFDHDRKKAAPPRHAGQSAPRHQLVDVRENAHARYSRQDDRGRYRRDDYCRAGLFLFLLLHSSRSQWRTSARQWQRVIRSACTHLIEARRGIRGREGLDRLAALTPWP
jgi:hypothetical protein